eukprot:TRINITY_DN36261_c0_g2_i1.p1 TRINITY_DN36261_c0_g2~~TRINITY_DN36261_c0_g2_i1.p1  ORF type:complete len:169 (+),score=18.85 TRINITY_DN36261_c0_g2_i1:2-508(+)
MSALFCSARSPRARCPPARRAALRHVKHMHWRVVRSRDMAQHALVSALAELPPEAARNGAAAFTVAGAAGMMLLQAIFRALQQWAKKGKPDDEEVKNQKEVTTILQALQNQMTELSVKVDAQTLSISEVKNQMTELSVKVDAQTLSISEVKEDIRGLYLKLIPDRAQP